MTSLQDEVNSIKWFHSIDFGSGIISGGTKSPKTLAAETDLFFGSVSLDGKTFLDIGAWNGFFSFEAKRRGASRVLTTDKFAWTDQRLNGRAGFDLARKRLGLDIEELEIDLPDITPENIGTFDAVLFAGVFYHLFDAPRLLKHVSNVAGQLLIVETHQDLLSEPRPAMVYYPGDTLAGDSTNFWGPNPLLICELLEESGFTRIYYRPNGIGHHRGVYLAFRDSKSVETFKFENNGDSWIDLENTNVVEISGMGASRTFRNLINFLKKRPMV